MTATTEVYKRNAEFAETFKADDLPPFPKMGAAILTCLDPRVDPAHVLGVGLGDAVVIRNTGGRVTDSVIDDLAALGHLAQLASGKDEPPFELLVIQHTDCGAELFAKPDFREGLLAKTGVDVSEIAITDHDEDLRRDLERLRKDPRVPKYITASAHMYHVESGKLRQVEGPSRLDA